MTTKDTSAAQTPSVTVIDVDPAGLSALKYKLGVAAVVGLGAVTQTEAQRQRDTTFAHGCAYEVATAQYVGDDDAIHVVVYKWWSCDSEMEIVADVAA